METTLEPGEYVLVDKLTPTMEPLPARRHRGPPPARRLGGRDGTPFIKRVIGLPGDKVSITMTAAST